MSSARRPLVWIVGTVLLAALILGWTLVQTDEDEPVRIGSKKFTEGVILGEVLHLLAQSTGEPARHESEMGGTRIVYDALVAGEIDAYVEYTGTLLSDIFAQEGFTTEEEVRRALAAEGIRMGPTLGFNNTYAIGVRRDRAQELGLGTIGDLRDHAELKFAFSHEFTERADSWPGLRRRYGLPQKATGIDHDLAYRAVAAGEADATDVYSTDAKIEVYDLVTLEDDLGYFPSYEAVILYREDLETKHPETAEAFGLLRDRIDEPTMTRMNAEVDVEGQDEGTVAAGFLARELDRYVTPVVETATARILRRTREHLSLVGVSLAIAVLIGLALGVVAAKTGRFGNVLIGVVGAAQTIPGLALLALLVPWLGIGWLPTVFALVVYSLLPIVRNTHAGITGIPRPITESAEVLGLSPATRLVQVELPLAAPSILAGIKTAAVWNVGLATIGALIGGGGYGQSILTGLRRGDTRLILEGAIPAIVLALIVQFLFDLLERRVVSPGLRPQRR